MNEAFISLFQLFCAQELVKNNIISTPLLFTNTIGEGNRKGMKESKT